jgi:uncharacterized membrane protein YkoI
MYTTTHSVSLVLCCGLALSACNRPSNTADRTSGGMNQGSSAIRDSARIDSTTARRSALAKVPGGRVLKGELENENGRLVYSFDIKRGTQPGIEEVQVDARNGAVVSLEHESPSAEAAEAKQDSTTRH